jgi:hypothetical protein
MKMTYQLRDLRALRGDKFVDHEGHEARGRKKNSLQGLFVKTTFKGNEEEGCDVAVAG